MTSREVEGTRVSQISYKKYKWGKRIYAKIDVTTQQTILIGNCAKTRTAKLLGSCSLGASNPLPCDPSTYP